MSNYPDNVTDSDFSDTSYGVPDDDYDIERIDDTEREEGDNDYTREKEYGR